MFDERLLARALTRPAQDVSARALDEIMHLAQRAEYQPAAERAFELLDAGCKDVRAFVVYALAIFAERGPAAVPSLFESLAALLPSPAARGAERAASRAADVALRFGFRTMRAHLDFDDRRPEAARQAWARHLSADTAAAVTRACTELRSALLAAFEEPLCEAELGAVVARLEAYCSRPWADKRATLGGGDVPARTARASEPEPEPVSAVPPAPAPEPPPEIAPAPPVFARRASDQHADFGVLAVSPALYEFMRKLQAFELLLTSGSLAKAAIVASDIRAVIAAFDPMVYLPSLLSPHFRLLSQHADELSSQLEHSGSPAWQAFEQLYRVDLDAFLEA
jgi:hypothetical protein